MIFSTIFAIISLFLLKENSDQQLILTNWISSGSLNIDWSVNLNLLTASMVVMVNFVSTIIHVYSVGYMEKDPRITIFMGYLGLLPSLCFFL